ncbi:unnamed protein product [Caenorhabditis auriculariae]|uniref:ABC1 atypical kinase-like domain-containing protein n=1 Tax=Caenorhabditis auriculariae TaxID=2777116 RepID=A0A8S1GXF6_9PELO|nr:unnamed protein product [Caenorhabditis auriculariae]
MNIPQVRVRKKSAEISFADYGNYKSDDEEEPTQENQRVIDLNDPLDAVDSNREQTHVVAAGSRGILQIVKLQLPGTSRDGSIYQPPSIIKDIDLRAYRRGKMNILYSSSSVSWNQIRDELIVTASPNGSIVLWNVYRKNIKENIYKSHERTATCAKFHHQNGNLLISGSRDCHVMMYDTRVAQKHVADFFEGTCEAVRDVAFGLHEGQFDTFFSGDDSGAIRLWDLRNTNKPVLQRTAHNAFVSTLALNPKERHLLATGGGRDKFVKVWSFAEGTIERRFVVETMAPLGRVLWRPDRPYHVVSCASVNDMNVHVWDIRRPYIPYATYDEHRDSVTDVWWPKNRADLFVSSGKDGLLILHSVDSGHMPISYACDVPFDVTPDGVLGIAVNSEMQSKVLNEMDPIPLAAKSATTSRASYTRRRNQRKDRKYESFRAPIRSILTCGVPDNVSDSIHPDAFYEIARRYYLGGKPLRFMCAHNARVARKFGKEHVSQTWKVIDALLEQSGIQQIYDEDARVWAEEEERKWEVMRKEVMKEGKMPLPSAVDLQVSYDSSEALTEVLTPFGYRLRRDPYEVQRDEDYGESVELSDDSLGIGKDIAAKDFYFGVGEANFTKVLKKEDPHLNEFMGLRDEAFELRNEKIAEKFFTSKNSPRGPQWHPMKEIVSLLRYHSEQGDVQTCASVVLVCGRKLLEVLDSFTATSWIESYMEMLDRLELFVTVARIKKYCAISRINQMSREGAFARLVHVDCDSQVTNGRCTKCEELVVPECSVCRKVIIGMHFTCHVCFHSSHPHHALQWFENNSMCASPDCLCRCRNSRYPHIKPSKSTSVYNPQDHYCCEQVAENNKRSFETLAMKQSRKQKNLVEFMSFYDIPWKELTKPQYSLQLRMVHCMWTKYQKDRRNTCDHHFYDFLYKAYARCVHNRLRDIFGKRPFPTDRFKPCCSEADQSSRTDEFTNLNQIESCRRVAVAEKPVIPNDFSEKSCKNPCKCKFYNQKKKPMQRLKLCLRGKMIDAMPQKRVRRRQQRRRFAGRIFDCIYVDKQRDDASHVECQERVPRGDFPPVVSYRPILKEDDDLRPLRRISYMPGDNYETLFPYFEDGPTFDEKSKFHFVRRILGTILEETEGLLKAAAFQDNLFDDNHSSESDVSESTDEEEEEFEEPKKEDYVDDFPGVLIAKEESAIWKTKEEEMLESFPRRLQLQAFPRNEWFRASLRTFYVSRVLHKAYQLLMRDEEQWTNLRFLIHRQRYREAVRRRAARNPHGKQPSVAELLSAMTLSKSLGAVRGIEGEPGRQLAMDIAQQMPGVLTVYKKDCDIITCNYHSNRISQMIQEELKTPEVAEIDTDSSSGTCPSTPSYDSTVSSFSDEAADVIDSEELDEVRVVRQRAMGPLADFDSLCLRWTQCPDEHGPFWKKLRRDRAEEIFPPDIEKPLNCEKSVEEMRKNDNGFTNVSDSRQVRRRIRKICWKAVQRWKESCPTRKAKQVAEIPFVIKEMHLAELRRMNNATKRKMKGEAANFEVVEVGNPQDPELRVKLFGEACPEDDQRFQQIQKIISLDNELIDGAMVSVKGRWYRRTLVWYINVDLEEDEDLPDEKFELIQQELFEKMCAERSNYFEAPSDTPLEALLERFGDTLEEDANFDYSFEPFNNWRLRQTLQDEIKDFVAGESPDDFGDACSFKSLQHCTKPQLNELRFNSPTAFPSCVLELDEELLLRSTEFDDNWYQNTIKIVSSQVDLMRKILHRRLVTSALDTFLPGLVRRFGTIIFKPGFFSDCQFFAYFDMDLKPCILQIKAAEALTGPRRRIECIRQAVSESKCQLDLWKLTNGISSDVLQAVPKIKGRDYKTMELRLRLSAEASKTSQTFSIEESQSIVQELMRTGLAKNSSRRRKIFAPFLGVLYRKEGENMRAEAIRQAKARYKIMQKYAYEIYRIHRNPDKCFAALLCENQKVESAEEYVARVLHDYLWPKIGPLSRHKTARNWYIFNICFYGNPNGRNRSVQLLNLKDEKEHFEKLRQNYEPFDARRRVKLANVVFETSSELMARVCPLANTERARNRWKKLVTKSHMRQRPLLDQMVTQEKIRKEDPAVGYLVAKELIPKLPSKDQVFGLLKAKRPPCSFPAMPHKFLPKKEGVYVPPNRRPSVQIEFREDACQLQQETVEEEQGLVEFIQEPEFEDWGSDGEEEESEIEQEVKNSASSRFGEKRFLRPVRRPKDEDFSDEEGSVMSDEEEENDDDVLSGSSSDSDDDLTLVEEVVRHSKEEPLTEEEKRLVERRRRVDSQRMSKPRMLWHVSMQCLRGARHIRSFSRIQTWRANINTAIRQCEIKVTRRTLLAGGVTFLAWQRGWRTASCEDDPWLLVPTQKVVVQKSVALNVLELPLTLVISTWRLIRKFIRCVSLFLRFAPLLAVYPLASRVQALDDFWWRILLYVVQSSGPTFIKLGQWASTRRDVFSKNFCDRLSVLHTKTRKKRRFRDAEPIIDSLFGKNFVKNHGRDVFTAVEPFSIGSGCIAQVYCVTVNVPAFEKAVGRKFPQIEGKKEQKIAIKVAEPNVDEKIELDLSILRTGAYVLEKLIPSLWYLDPKGALEQFEMVLRRQVDLSNEAKALLKFSENFDAKTSGIRFPLVFGYTKDAIAESFEEGVYINRLVAEDNNPDLKSRQSSAVRRRIALMGARTLLKMIFVDNFVHGDLHPGNILIRFNDNEAHLEGVHKAPTSDSFARRAVDFLRSALNWRSAPRLRFTESPDMGDEPTLVLLDTGIAISETPNNLNNLKSLFRCVVEKRGYEVGKLLLSQSPNQQCTEPERFCRQVEALVLKARSEKSLRTLNISALLSEMFTIVAEHKVELDSSFTTVVLSVMVLEGFGRSLDPDLDLFQCARPYLLNVLV